MYASRTLGVVLCATALGACAKNDVGTITPTPRESSPPGTPVTPPTFAVDPAARASDLLARQVAALEHAEPGDASFLATFDPEAVLLVPDPRRVDEPARGFRDAITQRAPHEPDSALAVRDLVAGGNAQAVWLTAVLAVTQDGTTYDVRVTEIATAASGWKVEAAAFTLASEPSAGREAPRPIGRATSAGALTALVATPTRLADALTPDAVVVGFTDRERGAAARQAVTQLPPMTVDGTPREVHGDGWGYTIAQLSYVEAGRKFPLRIAALVIAVPAAGGNWHVVAAHYTD